MNSVILHLQVPKQFRVNWHFGSGEVKIDFKMAPMVTILDFQSNLSSKSHLNTSNEGFESIGLSVKEKNYKIYFQDSVHGSHLGFPIGTIMLFLIYKSPRYFLPRFE